MIDRKLLISVFAAGACLSLGLSPLSAQETPDRGQFSGSVQFNGNWFVEDQEIGATGTPQYDDNLFGLETWVDLKYRIKGYEIGVRGDLFQNSNLLNPTEAYSDWGLGKAYITKAYGKFHLTAGYVYDEIGSGIIFKAYEDRALLIDNALVGGRVRYAINEAWEVTLMGGKQKNLFSLYESWLYGGKVEGYLSTGGEKPWVLTPGIGVMAKRLSDSQVDELDNVLSTYTPEAFVESVPYYTYAFTLYNTLFRGPFTWYAELAGKTEDTFFDPLEDRLLWTGETTTGKFVVRPGIVVYNAINYAGGGLGVSLEHKYTANFTFRADPFAALNRGMVNFLPPMSRLNTYRLTGRYVPATQEVGEHAIQLEATYKINRRLRLLVNGSWVDDTRGSALYREAFTEVTFREARKMTLVGGVQYQWYNQERYEGKAGVDAVQTVIPYVDYLHIFDRKKSLRIELQYMYTRQDFGSWLFGLAEFSIAPHWVFEISDMWNIVPFVDDNGKKKNDPLHFPTVGVAYSIDSYRLGVRYVKQVEGVVCSGGICRFEPAFSGLRIQVNGQF